MVCGGGIDTIQSELCKKDLGKFLSIFLIGGRKLS